METSKSIGSAGEDRAAAFLKRRGYKIIERNYHSRYGEIDIIASNGEYIVFAEVKQRKNADFGEAREFVTPSKQRKVRVTAEIWLSDNETELQPRFDIIEIYGPEGLFGGYTINHLEDAF